MKSRIHRSGCSNVVLTRADDSNLVDSWSTVCACVE